MPYACSECDFTAMDNFALENHMKSNHNGSLTDSNDYVIINTKSKLTFKCSNCRYKTKRKEHIDIHSGRVGEKTDEKKHADIKIMDIRIRPVK